MLVNERIEFIVDWIKGYSDKVKFNPVSLIIGVSGGVDSAVASTLSAKTKLKTIAVSMPIRQNSEQHHLSLQHLEWLKSKYNNVETKIIELDHVFNSFEKEMSEYENKLAFANSRSRLRMITLYNLAHKVAGCVGSTDNFSELAAGFWTLHGDVGDIAPIQSLNKSWEVPMLAKMLDVPQATVDAVPTDGLGISNSDADQLGMSYLEFDIALFELLSLPRLDKNTIELYINSITDLKVNKKLTLVANRVASTTFKRFNPYNLNHPIFNDRFNLLETLDRSL